MSEQSVNNKNGGHRLAPKEPKKLTPRQRKREKKIMVVMIVLAVIMVLAATVAVLYTRWIQKPDLPSHVDSPPPVMTDENKDPNAADSTESPSEEVSREPEYDPVQPKVSGERKSEDYYSILVFGTDESSNLTDTMMVVSYDVTNQKATAMSIPRDTLINSRASGVDNKKMNAVYSRSGRGEKGINALMNEVSELIGFSVDYYVVVNWELVGLMVDAIDGVYFDIPNRMKYSDPLQDLYIDLQAGYQLLDGDMAMQLVRWRKNDDGSGIAANGDIGRLDIQHDFLKAVLKQALQLKNATKISELAKLFGEHVVSNLTIENLFWFGSQAILNGLDVDSVEFVTMPFYYGEYPVKSGDKWKLRSFVYPARNSLLTLINESLNPFVQDVTLKQLDLVYINSSGGLSSTTGSLADSSMATVPEEYLIWKALQENPDAELDPDADPDVTGEPGTDPDADPGVSGDPSISPGSDPSSDPDTSADPEATDDPAASGDPEPDSSPDVSSAPEQSEDPNVAPTHPGYYTDPEPSVEPEPDSDSEPSAEPEPSGDAENGESNT